MNRQIKEFHNIMPIKINIPSVLKHGILPHESGCKLPHKDISMADVQEKRDMVQVPGGLKLHKYANLYFHARNPMMSAINNRAASLCVLRVSTEVLKLDGVVITDRNAASKYVRFLSPNAINELDLEKIYAEDWRHPGDMIAYWRHKSMKCAEVLVPNCIEPKYIQGAYVVSKEAKKRLAQQGFAMPIKVDPHIFLL